MDLAGLVVFSTALFIAAASPGPGIAAIVARVLGRGPARRRGVQRRHRHRRRGVADLAIVGLAALAQAFHGIFLVVKWAGAAYLLYLA